MDFLKELGKMMEEEARKTQTAYQEQQSLLKQMEEQASAQPVVQEESIQLVQAPSQPARRGQRPRKQPAAKQPQAPQAAPARIDEPAKPAPARVEPKLDLKFTRDQIVKGIIISEIFGPPPCKRKKAEE